MSKDSTSTNNQSDASLSNEANNLFISIMLPIRNEEAFIAETLRQLYEQDYPKNQYEILIGDGMSDDNTIAIIDQFQSEHPDLNIKIFNNTKKLSSAARNLAAQNATGEYVLLIDGHVHIPSSSLISDYANAAITSGAKVLGRPQPLNPPGISVFQKTLAAARSSFLAHSGESFIYSEHEGWTSPISIGVMYHRSVFDEVGYFDESFDAAEDLEFNYRLEKAKYQCFTSPKLTVNYYPRENLKGLYKQMGRYGYGRALFIHKHPERFTLETIIPAGFTIFLATFLLLPFLPTLLSGLWSAIFTLYFALTVFESFRISRKIKGINTLMIPPIILTVHLGMGVGFMKGFIKTKLGQK